jgi:hypothetical protein
MLVADGITHCDWQLEHAFNPEIYYLERSSDLMHWEVVKTISASANQESGVDFATPEGSTYYRVRVVLSGGTEIVSNSDHVSWKKRIFEVSPNPGNDVFSLSGSNLESLVIYDVSGRVIGFSWLSNNQIAIHTPAAGCYIFEVGGDNNAPPLRQRVIIN